MLETAIQAVAADMFREMFYSNMTALNKIMRDYPNIKIRTFPAPVLKAMKDATNKLLEEYASKNAKFKEILEDQRAFMKKARAWTMISDYYYLESSIEASKQIVRLQYIVDRFTLFTIYDLNIILTLFRQNILNFKERKKYEEKF